MPPARRPRPVAGLPALDPAAVAKAWLLELLAAAPLERAATIPVAELAEDAPTLCGALLRALGDDAALDGLALVAVHAADLAGADDAVGAARAVEALRAATWRALRGALGADVDPALVGDAAERLAHAASVVAVAALGELPAPVEQAPVVAQGSPVTVVPAGVATADVLAHDTRGDAAPASVGAEPWLAAIARRIARHAEDRVPFAVLAAEVSDASRWLAADPSGGALHAAEAAVTEALRPGDQLVPEGPGRFWVIAPDTGADAARELAGGLAQAAGRAALVGLAVGVAAWPHDGADAETLAARADERLLGALAAGLPVA